MVCVVRNGSMCVLGGGTVFTVALKAFGVCFRNKEGEAPKLDTERSSALYPVNSEAASSPVPAFFRETD